ncbi:MAG: hypothetical protein M3209_13230 [Acidobacteriota bacterium]|nr:hypothetical protein [Acidobacteriota bacterium]
MDLNNSERKNAGNQALPVCLLCGTAMQPLMQMNLRTGGSQGFHSAFSLISEMTQKTLNLDTYRCPNCTRLQFYDMDSSLPNH